jgi:hypothetical protein
MDQWQRQWRSLFKLAVVKVFHTEMLWSSGALPLNAQA